MYASLTKQARPYLIAFRDDPSRWGIDLGQRLGMLRVLGPDAVVAQPFLVETYTVGRRVQGWYMRLFAVNAIDAIGKPSPEAIAVLKDALHDEETRVRRCAEIALYHLKGDIENSSIPQTSE